MRLLTTLLLVLSVTAHARTVREPAVAGSFYPDDSTELSALVQSHLDAVTDLPEIDGQIVALVVPHAGLVYSGPIAACAYKLLENESFKKVVLCGPSHRYGFEGSSVCGADVAWQTPLGRVNCNAACSRLLTTTAGISVIPEGHRSEHSLEVQLPYLQTVLDDFEIVPIVVGYQRPEAIQSLTDGLMSLPADDQTFLIASTDWQHYRSRQAGWPMDSLGIDCLKSFEPERLDRLLASGEVEACGGGAVVAVMRAARARGADRAALLKYGDSGDLNGDRNRVVGYAAAVLYRSDKAETADTQAQEQRPYELTESQRQQLLEIARSSLTAYLSEGDIPDFDIKDEHLREEGAAFVTLNKGGRLRGCIGHTTAAEPLYRTVAQCAVQAGVADPRFPPVKLSELENIHFEVSVLTPMQRVESLDEIEVGRDGLMLISGTHRGLLLPQVATEYGWNRQEFLQNTCRKAGLPTDAYLQSSTEIYRFQALVFGE